jgi:HK97 family phage portal protein
MSLRETVAAWIAPKPEKRATYTEIFGSGWGPATYTGKHVNENTALNYSAVFACVRVLSFSVASLPLILYRRTADNGRERAIDLPLYEVLHDTPNPEMTSFNWTALVMTHALTWGNAYSEIEYNGGGRPVALWPLNPASMEDIRRRNGELVYQYRLPGGEVAMLPGYRVHHMRGLSSDGIHGYSPVRKAMQSIALGLATEEFGARFFGNGARPGSVLKFPGQLSDEAFDRLRAHWADTGEGLSNSNRMQILEEGLDIETIGVPPEEAQFLETRKFQVVDIARWYGVPPHKIGALENATFSNIEHQAIEFVTDSLRPWLVNHERMLRRDLLTKLERKRLFIEYLVDALLRGETRLAATNRMGPPSRTRS